MKKTKHKVVNPEIRIRAIELLNSSLNLPAEHILPISDFNFNLKIEMSADVVNKLVFVIVHVEIKNNGQLVLLGSLSVSCIFEIANFEKVVKVEDNDIVIIPPPLIETLNIISVSTTRGILFSTFKGTFLHGAILPIIDLRDLQTTEKEGDNYSNNLQ